MTWDLLGFYLHIWRTQLTGNHYREDLIYESDHPHYRRFTKRYRKKQSMVKNFWIGAGILTLIFPFMHVAFILSLLTTMISFCYLDETK